MDADGVGSLADGPTARHHREAVGMPIANDWRSYSYRYSPRFANRSFHVRHVKYAAKNKQRFSHAQPSQKLLDTAAQEKYHAFLKVNM